MVGGGGKAGEEVVVDGGGKQWKRRRGRNSKTGNEETAQRVGCKTATAEETGLIMIRRTG